MKKILFFLLLVCPAAAWAQIPAGVVLGGQYPFVQPEFFAANGVAPCNACKLFTYQAGTSIPLATYTDSLLTVPNTNPIILNSTGRPSGSNGIYLLPQQYRVILQDSHGSTIWTRDNVYDLGALLLTSVTSNMVFPQSFGAKGDGLQLGGAAGGTGCTGTAASATISCPTAVFTSKDVGKFFDLSHAGKSNCGLQYFNVTGSTFNCNLTGVINQVLGPTQVVLSSGLVNSVSNEQFSYGTSDDAAFAALIASGAKNIGLFGTYVITGSLGVGGGNPLINITFTSPSPSVGRFLNIGPIAYSGLATTDFFVDNGSTNVTFQGVGFIGTNEIGELTSPVSSQGVFICSGVPGNAGCNQSSGVTNISFTNCDFSHHWGIGLHNVGTGTTLGQQLVGVFVTGSTATYNSFDGFNLIPYDTLIYSNDVSNFNGTGGIESWSYGSITVSNGQYRYNRGGGVTLGGANDMITHGTGCQVTGNDISFNGNNFTGNTVGAGVIIGDGVQNCTITGNNISFNSLIGLQILNNGQDTNFTVTGNTIVSNGIVGASQVGTGVEITVNNANISGNTIVDTSTNTILTATRTSNVVTMTTTSPNNYKVGYTVVISGTTGAAFDGSFVITTIVTDSTFKFAQTASNIGPLTGGSIYSDSLGYKQAYGMEVQSGSANSQITGNWIQHNRTRNVDFAANTSQGIVFESASNYLTTFGNDVFVNGGAPAFGNITIRQPDLQETTANVCTTAGSVGATCTTTVTQVLGLSPNYTTCTLDNTPNAQSGVPVIVKVDTSTSTTSFTVTIAALTASAAGNGTMRCKTNIAYTN